VKNSYIENMTAAQQAAIQRLNPQSGASVGIAMQMGLAHNARNQAPAPEAEIDEDGVRALPQDRLDSQIAQHNKLIDKIKADASGRDLTPREESRLSDLQESLVVFSAEDERRRQPAGRKTMIDVRGSVAFPDAASKGAKAASPAAAARSGVIFNAGTRDFSAHLFGAAPRADANEIDSYFNALATRTFDPRMATATEGIGVDGGFAVPQVWYRGVIDQAMQASEFAQRCRVFPAESNNLTIPMLDTRNRQNGVAGLIARWSAEAEQQTPQVMKWTAREMKLKKTFILSEASSELVEDGINYAQQLTEGMSLATAQALDAAILYGTGVGMPLGIINSPGALEIPKESGQIADTLTWGNLVAMYARLSPACQKRATWFVTPDALPQLMAIKVPGTDAPALLSGGFNDAGAGAPAMSIFGRPVVVTEIAAQIGDKGDIVFADMSQYALLVKNGARMENSIGPGFDRDVVQFRMIMRVDGTPLWPTAITPYNGGATQTWATYLAERA
jgi:HK97 family phage major capsid protein